MPAPRTRPAIRTRPLMVKLTPTEWEHVEREALQNGRTFAGQLRFAAGLTRLGSADPRDAARSGAQPATAAVAV